MSTVPNPPVPPLVLTIIAAAIHATYGASAHIVTIAPLNDAEWAREGRRDIFSSHRIR